MAQKPIEIMNLKQIIQLKIQGTSNREISDLLDIHRNTINKYIRLISASDLALSELLELDNASLLELFPTTDTIDDKRYEVLSGYFPLFVKELRKVGCTKEKLWKRYITHHTDGYGSSQFNYHLNHWLKNKKVSGKLNHAYGEKIFVDYTGEKLQITDKSTGEIIDVEVFVAILPASHYVYVEATLSQQKEYFISSVNNTLSFFGGVPKVMVADNLKSAVNKSSKYEPILNKTFKDQGQHYGFAINPTRSYKPQDKALVEGAVKLVYQRIFYELSNQTFFSIKDLNKAILEKVKAFNLHHMKTYDTSRFKLFNEYEKSKLQPLPKQKYELKEYRIATVQKMGYIYLSVDKNYYSVPYRYIGKKVEVQYNTDNIEIYFNNQRIASHLRNYRKGYYTTNKDHLSSSHSFYSGWKPEYFLKQANDIGEDVYQFVSKMMAQAEYPEIAYKSALGIIHLKSNYEKSRINKACKIGLENNLIRYRNIKNILDNNADLNIDNTSRSSVPKHNNIRGNYN